MYKFMDLIGVLHCLCHNALICADIGQAIDEKIRELSNCHLVYQGLDLQKVMTTHLPLYL